MEFRPPGRAVLVNNNSWFGPGGDLKDKPATKKADKEDGVVAKKKDAEVQTVKLKDAKGKDKTDWSDELGQKKKADNIPNFAASFGW